MALRLLPAVLALLVLGAHFLRAGYLALAALALAVVALLFVRRPWAARAVQGALVLGALEWLRTLALLALERRASGAPYLRMTLILVAVARATPTRISVMRRYGAPAARRSLARSVSVRSHSRASRARAP